MKNIKLIQKLIAILLTNPNIAENYDSFRDKFFSVLNLDALTVTILDDFYVNNKEKFTAAARILKQNRWDGIKRSLPLTSSHVDQDILNATWESYINNNDFSNVVPKNPLIESVRFLEFLDKHLLITPLEQELLKYERVRNEVIFKYYNNFSKCPRERKIVDARNFNKLSVFIHECYMVENFKADIYKIISKNENILLHSNKAITILFYKDLNKEGISSLKISVDIEDIIKKISNKQTELLAVYSLYKKMLSKTEFFQILLKLKKFGVIMFIESQEGVQ